VELVRVETPDLYRTPRGQSPLPPDEWIRAALGQNV
jgi:hypothetical protein